MNGSRSKFKVSAPRIGSGRTANCYTALAKLRLLPDERRYLEEHCPYFHSEYLNFVENLQLDPENQVQVTFVPQAGQAETSAETEESGERDAKRIKVQDVDGSSLDEMGLIEMDIQGPWRDCILYEVPLMSICESSRLYPRLRQTNGSS